MRRARYGVHVTALHSGMRADDARARVVRAPGRGHGCSPSGVAGVVDPTEFTPSTPLTLEFCSESVATQYENGVFWWEASADFGERLVVLTRLLYTVVS